MRINLVVLIGLPGSGKTTICKDINSYLNDSTSSCCIHFEFDKLVVSVDDFKKSRSEVTQKIRDSIASIVCTGEIQEYTYLIDDNMYYRSMRYEIYKIAKALCQPPEKTLHYTQLYLKRSVDECLARNALRQTDARVSDEVIIKMAEKLEEPDESFWEASTFVSKDSALSREFALEIVEFIRNAEIVASLEEIQHREEQIELMRKDSRDNTSNSILHQCELLLRNSISYQLCRTDLSSEEKKRRSPILQKLKKKGLYNKMSHSPLCTRLNLWKATRRESPLALKSKIREDCLRTLKENRMAVFANRRKFLGIVDCERRQLQDALNKENGPLEFDDLLKLYDEVTAELVAATNEQLERHLDEVDAIASIENQVVCPSCFRGEISLFCDTFRCSSCNLKVKSNPSLSTLFEFSEVFSKALSSFNEQHCCSGFPSVSVDNDEDPPAAFICCSECDLVIPIF